MANRERLLVAQATAAAGAMDLGLACLLHDILLWMRIKVGDDFPNLRNLVVIRKFM